LDTKNIKGAGLGLRFSFLNDIYEIEEKPTWFEIAPENWMDKGGKGRKILENIRADFPIGCHGLSLSIGSPDKVDKNFLKRLKDFLDYFEIDVYSEHLSYSSLNGSYIYDLLPVPFSEKLAEYIGEKARYVQDFLERPLILENISYYYAFNTPMSEAEFINLVMEKGNCHLLLDVNNVYVNSINHGYDPYQFIEDLDLSKVAYIHIAGHDRFEDTIIDTHGSEVCESVYDLLDFSLKKLGDVPVLLERDNNIPEYEELIEEYKKVKWSVENARV